MYVSEGEAKTAVRSLVCLVFDAGEGFPLHPWHSNMKHICLYVPTLPWVVFCLLMAEACVRVSQAGGACQASNWIASWAQG